MACVVWLSPLEGIQRRARVTASTSIVKLEVETVSAAMSSWMVVAPCLTVKPRPDWSLVTEPSVYTKRSCSWLFSWMRLSLISDSVFPAGHSRQCFHNFSAHCPTLADLSIVPLLWGLIRSQWHWTPHFDTAGRGGLKRSLAYGASSRAIGFYSWHSATHAVEVKSEFSPRKVGRSGLTFRYSLQALAHWGGADRETYIFPSLKS